MTPPRPRSLLALALAALIAPGAGVSAGQPTFGRPKPDKRQRDPRPEPPKPAKSDPHFQPPDAQPNQPDAPMPHSPMFEPGAGERAFVPSPEEWLDGDPPRQKPSGDLAPGAVYAWRSTGGLRFSYTVPVDLKPADGADVVIICHPMHTDFRWGMANHLSAKAAEERGSARLAFRPSNFVVSVDGIDAERDSPQRRSFNCDMGDATRFRDFVLELTRTFPARRFYLYGFGAGSAEVKPDASGEGAVPAGAGGGGQFVMYFSRAFPALADGVVAYGASAPPGDKGKSGVPIVIVHGVKNALVPFSDALKLLASNRERDNTLVRLRALRAFNDYPNPVRVSESIDWLGGVRTDDPAEALACVESMLTPKPGDEYDFLAPVWYAGAREVLGRILGESGPLTSEAPFGEGHSPSAAVRDRAAAIVKLLDAEADANLAALRPLLPESPRVSDWPLDGKPWLGHLIAARDDLRGTAPMESFAAVIGFDEALRAHTETGEELMSGWGDRSETENFAGVVAAIPRCFLYEGLPVDLGTKMKAWKRRQQAGELELSPEALEGYENLTNCDEGYRKGLDAYQKIWRQWKFEPTKPAPGNATGAPDQPLPAQP